MKPAGLILALSSLSLVLPDAAMAKAYSCKLEPARALHENGSGVTLTPISFGHVDGEAWTFDLNVQEPDKTNKKREVVLDWPSNPFQLAGRFPYVSTGNGAIAFMTFSGGPCMFTEWACISQVQFVETSDGNAQIQILPAALATNKDKKENHPFVALIDGTCTEKKS